MSRVREMFFGLRLVAKCLVWRGNGGYSGGGHRHTQADMDGTRTGTDRHGRTRTDTDENTD